jgi:PAS domain S-box-containing protein
MAVTRELCILIVEDNPGDARLLQENLHDVLPKAEFHRVEHLEDALREMTLRDFDVVMLDLSLPDSQGLATVSRMMESAAAPIVVLTGAQDEQTGQESVRLGAQDYLMKGQADAALVGRAVRYALERHRTQRELARARDELEMRVRERTADLEQAIVKLGDEVTERMAAERELRESELTLREIIESLPQAVWVGLPDLTRTVYVNAAYERLMGQPRQQLYIDARSALAVMHPDDRSAVMKLLAGAQYARGRAAGGTHLKFRAVMPDRTTRTMMAHILPIRDEGGGLLRICALLSEG